MTVVVVGFHCDIISCELEQRGVRNGAAAAESGARGRGNAVSLTLVLRQGQFFSSIWRGKLAISEILTVIILYDYSCPAHRICLIHLE